MQISLNILYHGFKPARPLHLEEKFDADLSHQVCYNLTTEPLATSEDGKRLVGALAEVRGDWKFLKDGLKNRRSEAQENGADTIWLCQEI